MGIGTAVLAGAEEGTDVAHEEHGHRHQHQTGERQAKPQQDRRWRNELSSS